MSIIIKIFFAGLFLAIVYFGVELIKTQAFSYFLPQLPDTARCFMVYSGLDKAIDYFLQIIIYGFTIKQMISYIRSI